MPSIPFRGVRISWLASARNSVLALKAFSRLSVGDGELVTSRPNIVAAPPHVEEAYKRRPAHDDTARCEAEYDDTSKPSLRAGQADISFQLPLFEPRDAEILVGEVEAGRN